MKMNVFEYAIFAGVPEKKAQELRAEARVRGLTTLRANLIGAQFRQQVIDSFDAIFCFPSQVSSLDAVIDWASDAENLPESIGYFLEIQNRGSSDLVDETLGSIMPSIVNRWRSQPIQFVVVISDASTTLDNALREANERLSQAGKLPWALPTTGPVRLVLGKS